MASTSVAVNSKEKCNKSFCKACALIFTYIICVLYAGTLFGWASLSFVYKKDGVFSQLCEEKDKVMTYTVGYSNENSSQLSVHNVSTSTPPASCDEQDSMLSLAFTASLVALGIFAFPAGLFFDKFGLRLTRSITAVIAVIGYLLLGYASEGATSWFILIGGPLIGVSCGTYIMTNTYVAALAGQFTSSVLLLYSGGINISAAMFACVKLAADAGITRNHSMIFLSSLIFIDVINTWLFLPAFKIKKSVDENEDQPEKHKLNDIENDQHGDEGELKNVIYKPLKNESSENEQKLDDIESKEGKHISFRQCAVSPYCLLHIMWFAIINLRLMSFISDFNQWINMTTNGDEDLNSHYVTFLGIIQFVSIIVAPFSGIVMDFMRKKLTDQNMIGFSKSIIAAPSLIICSLCTVSLSVVVFIKSSTAIYAAVIILEMTRAIAYGTGIAYIEITFPGEHFGKIFGLAYAINGITVFLQYPIHIIAYKMKQHILSCVILLLLTAVSFIHPFFILWKSRL